MKCNRLLLLIAVVFLLVNCSKDETPIERTVAEEKPNPKIEEPKELETEVYFILNVDATYETAPKTSDEIENWIIIHDDNGNLLDYKKFEIGEKLVFEGKKTDLTDKIIITTFTYHLRLNQYWHDFETYPRVEKGSEWFFKTYKWMVSDLNEISKYDLNVVNVPVGANNPFYFMLSTNVLPQYPTLTEASPNTNGLYNISLKDINVYENKDFLLSILDDRGDFYSRFFTPEEIQNNQFYNFEEFLLSNEYVRFYFPTNHKSVDYYVTGLDEDQEYTDIGYTLLDAAAKTPVYEASFGYSYVQGGGC